MPFGRGKDRTIRRRGAVITGLGIVSPLGIGAEDFWACALAGKPGIGLLTLVTDRDLPVACRIVGEVRNFHPEEWVTNSFQRQAGRFSQFAVAAAKMALKDSCLATAMVPPERIQVSLGTSMSGLVDVHERSFSAF